MRTKNVLISIACLSSFMAGCTYQAVAIKTAVPAGEIRVDRIRDVHATVVTNFANENLNKNARKPGLACTAHNYPVDIEAALRRSIGIIMDSSFASYESVNSIAGASNKNQSYTFIFDIQEYEPVFSYSSGFFSGTALGRVTLTSRVTVLDKDGKEILRTTVSGSGHAEADGGCNKGSEALSMAATKSISDMLEKFVYKVINSDQLNRQY